MQRKLGKIFYDKFSIFLNERIFHRKNYDEKYKEENKIKIDMLVGLWTRDTEDLCQLN